MAYQCQTRDAIGRNLLKELIFSAAIIPFMPRKHKGTPLLIDRGKAIELAPIDTDHGTVKAGVAPRLKTADRAVSEFLDEMMEHAAGDSLLMKYVQLSYDQLAPTNDWPPLSNKTLSSKLVNRGCRRRQVDLRKQGEGRPTAIVFPKVRKRAGTK